MRAIFHVTPHHGEPKLPKLTSALADHLRVNGGARFPHLAGSSISFEGPTSFRFGAVWVPTPLHLVSDGRVHLEWRPPNIAVSVSLSYRRLWLVSLGFACLATTVIGFVYSWSIKPALALGLVGGMWLVIGGLSALGSFLRVYLFLRRALLVLS